MKSAKYGVFYNDPTGNPRHVATLFPIEEFNDQILKDKVLNKIIVAELIGLSIHPLDIKVGDILSYDEAGLSQFKVESCDLTQTGKYHKVGHALIKDDAGNYRAIYFDGDRVLQPIYKIVK